MAVVPMVVPEVPTLFVVPLLVVLVPRVLPVAVVPVLPTLTLLPAVPEVPMFVLTPLLGLAGLVLLTVPLLVFAPEEAPRAGVETVAEVPALEVFGPGFVVEPKELLTPV